MAGRLFLGKKLAGVKRKLTRFASEGNGRMPCWFLIIDVGRIDFRLQTYALLVSDYGRVSQQQRNKTIHRNFG